MRECCISTIFKKKTLAKCIVSNSILGSLQYFEPMYDTEPPYPTIEYPPPLYNHPPPLEMQRVKLEVSPKHKETQTICMYLGIYRIALFWVWTVSADIFGWTYLYLYLYLNRCICICIWIKVEQNICICICIWKIQIFVFVFVFVFDKTYLTPALAKIHWDSPINMIKLKLNVVKQTPRADPINSLPKWFQPLHEL